jgi:excisionase family DNA binding protein
MRAAFLNDAEGRWEQTVAVQEWYSVQDVCTILAVGNPSVYGAIKRGTLKAYRVSGVVKVKHDDLVSYIARRSAEPSLDPGALQIEEIIPEREADKAAQAMMPEGSQPPASAAGGDLEFLEE